MADASFMDSEMCLLSLIYVSCVPGAGNPMVTETGFLLLLELAIQLGRQAMKKQIWARESV